MSGARTSYYKSQINVNENQSHKFIRIVNKNSDFNILHVYIKKGITCRYLYWIYLKKNYIGLPSNL